jgi:transcriptional regulator with XRE-family HTH domain
MVYFSTNLRRVRMNKGLNQTKLAQMLDLRPNTISNYENGISSPDFTTLLEMVKIFEVSVDDFLYKDLSHHPKYNSVVPPPGDRNVFAGDDPGTQLLEEPEAEYLTKPKEETAFWVIMEQIQDIRREVAQLKEALLQKRYGKM